MGSATHTTDMQHYQTQIPYLWAFQDIKTLILVLKEIITKNIKTLGNPVFSRVFFMSAFGERKYINIENL